MLFYDPLELLGRAVVVHLWQILIESGVGLGITPRAMRRIR